MPPRRPAICSMRRRCRSRRRRRRGQGRWRSPMPPPTTEPRQAAADTRAAGIVRAAPATCAACTTGQHRRAAADAEGVERRGLAAPTRQRLRRLHARAVSRCPAAGGDGRRAGRAHGRPRPQLPVDRRSFPRSGSAARLGAGGGGGVPHRITVFAFRLEEWLDALRDSPLVWVDERPSSRDRRSRRGCSRRRRTPTSLWSCAARSST